MSVHFLEAALRDPLPQLDGLFSVCAAAPTGPNIETFMQQAKTQFGAVFEDKFLCNIPVLDKHLLVSGKLRPNTVVRFRGIVRDMLSPEFYIGAYVRQNPVTGRQEWIQSIFKESIPVEDFEQISFDGAGVLHGERLPIVLAAVPGENDWVRDFDITNVGEDDNIRSDMVLEINEDSISAERIDRKRVLEEEVGSYSVSAVDRNVASKASGVVTGNAVAVPPFLAIAGKDAELLSCVTKFVNTADEQALKLNDLVEVVAIYTLDNTLPSSIDRQQLGEGQVVDEGDFDMIFDDALPPPSIMPRLQVLAHRRLHSSFPYITSVMDGRAVLKGLQGSVALSDIPSQIMPTGESIDSTRTALISALAAVFASNPNDKRASVAAEYVLMSLLSRIEARNDMGIVGGFTLNLVGASSGDDIVRKLSNLINMIVPRSVNVK